MVPYMIIIPLSGRDNKDASGFQHLGTNCPEVVKTGERHTPLPGRIRAPPMRRAFSADRTAAPTGRHSPVAKRRSPRGKSRRRYSPGSPLDLDCWSTAAGVIPDPGRARGQHGAHRPAPGLSACWPGQKSLWSSGKFPHQSVTPPPFALGQIVSKSRYRSSWCFSASRRNPSFEEPSIIS